MLEHTDTLNNANGVKYVKITAQTSKGNVF